MTSLQTDADAADLFATMHALTPGSPAISQVLREFLRDLPKTWQRQAARLAAAQNKVDLAWEILIRQEPYATWANGDYADMPMRWRLWQEALQTASPVRGHPARRRLLATLLEQPDPPAWLVLQQALEFEAAGRTDDAVALLLKLSPSG